MTLELIGETRDDLFDAPEGWPQGVSYLATSSVASANLPLHLQLHLCTAPKAGHDCHPFQSRKNAYTVIQLITNETPFQPAFGSELQSHPTVGQYGLFARRDIPPNTLVVAYLGHVHLAEGEDPQSRYDAAIEAEDGTRCGIDATQAGSEARFVNDYRGILQRPNLFFKDWTARFPDGYRASKRGAEMKYPKRVKGMALYSGAHSIRKGTELCASYGKGWWAARAD